MRKVPGGWIGAAVVLMLVLGLVTLVLGVVVLGALAWGTYKLGGFAVRKYRDRLDTERAYTSGLAARAQAENEQYLSGDARGVYGAYQPVSLD